MSDSKHKVEVFWKKKKFFSPEIIGAPFEKNLQKKLTIAFEVDITIFFKF